MSTDLSRWAAARGHSDREVGPLLEPCTAVLHRGLGAGERRGARAPYVAAVPVA